MRAHWRSQDIYKSQPDTIVCSIYNQLHLWNSPVVCQTYKINIYKDAKQSQWINKSSDRDLHAELSRVDKRVVSIPCLTIRWDFTSNKITPFLAGICALHKDNHAQSHACKVKKQLLINGNSTDIAAGNMFDINFNQQWGLVQSLQQSTASITWAAAPLALQIPASDAIQPLKG